MNGARNTLYDLNNHLFEQLERLNDDELTDEQLEKEIKRTDAMTDIATQIISNAHVVLKATELKMEHARGDVAVPRMLTGSIKENDDKK